MSFGGVSGYARACAGDAMAAARYVPIFTSPPPERFCCALMLAILDGHSRQGQGQWMVPW